MIEARELAFVSNVVLAPKTTHHVDNFFAHLHPSAAVQAEDFKLMLLSWLTAPAEADAEIHAPAADPVETGELISEQDWMAQRGEKDRRAQAHSTGARADRGQSR